MSKIIDFYLNVKRILDDHQEKLNVIEIKPDAGKLYNKYSLDFVNFIAIINSKEYLIFLKSGLPGVLSKEDLDIFFKIFLLNPKKIGIIIIWNDAQLSSVILSIEDFHADLEKVLIYIKSNLLSLENLIMIKLFPSENKFILSSKSLKKEISELKEFDYLNKFRKNLLNTYSNYKEDSVKKQNFDVIIKEDLDAIIQIFSDFLSNEIDKHFLKKRLNSL